MDQPSNMPFKISVDVLAIVGTRTFGDFQHYLALYADPTVASEMAGKDYLYLQHIMSLHVNVESIRMIISGGARGTDKLAERFAKENGIPFREYPADWDFYGSRAGPIRNAQIVAASDAIMAFWDGKSRGTQNTILLATKAGKTARIIRVDAKLRDKRNQEPFGNTC